MRRTLIASLLFGLAALAHHDGAGRKRKSLGFGPAHPHAVYRTNPSVMANSLGSNADPLGVLALFMTEHHDDDESRSFKIRPDSYFDKNTNIHHFYIRQLVNGLQVVDGDMNVNIKDGRVLSFGDSVRLLRFLAHILFNFSSSTVARLLRLSQTRRQTTTPTVTTAASLCSNLTSARLKSCSLETNRLSWRLSRSLTPTLHPFSTYSGSNVSPQHSLTTLPTQLRTLPTPVPRFCNS